jgi:hypothetical protein
MCWRAALSYQISRVSKTPNGRNTSRDAMTALRLGPDEAPLPSAHPTPGVIGALDYFASASIAGLFRCRHLGRHRQPGCLAHSSPLRLAGPSATPRPALPPAGTPGCLPSAVIGVPAGATMSDTTTVGWGLWLPCLGPDRRTVPVPQLWRHRQPERLAHSSQLQSAKPTAPPHPAPSPAGASGYPVSASIGRTVQRHHVRLRRKQRCETEGRGCPALGPLACHAGSVGPGARSPAVSPAMIR